MKTLVILLMLTTLANAGINFDMEPKFQDIRKQYVKARGRNFKRQDSLDLHLVEMRIDTLAAAKDAPISRVRFQEYLDALRLSIWIISNDVLKARMGALEAHIKLMENANRNKDYAEREKEFMQMAKKYLSIIDPVGSVVVAKSEPVKEKP